MNDPYKDIYSFLEAQETAYQKPIELPGGWNWSMKDHLDTSYLYTNTQLKTGKNDYKPVKNITRPILNLQHRSEDIELKDVQLYVDDPELYHLSLLVKKYHDDVFVREHDLDTFFDELNVSRIDFGGGLSKQIGDFAEVVPLHSIVFCDQTDILSGPIGIKHFYAPDQLQGMAKSGWGEGSNGATGTIADAIRLARESKTEKQNNTVSETPGRYIEVYEIHGSLPRRFLDPSDTSGLFSRQLHIITKYQKKDKTNGYIILYRSEEPNNPFKMVKRDPVYGRGLGFGGAEELFESQVWINYDMIRMQAMLDAASKTILKASGTGGAEIAKKNKVKDLDNLAIIDVGQDGDLAQVDTFPRNLALFEKSIAEWEAHAQQMGAANDAIMGESPSAGTPFKLQELVTAESHGLHEYRRGQFAKHIEELYNDWFIPKMVKEIVNGATFLSELSLDEIQYVTEQIVTKKANDRIKELVLSGETPTTDEIELYKETVRDTFKKKGTKHFIEIVKGEFKKVPIAVKVNVAGKSKNLATMTDKLVNLFRFAFSNPQGFALTMQVPGMAKAFNEILEFSGLSPADFSGIEKLAVPPPAPTPAPATPTPSPVTPEPTPAYGAA